MEFKDYYKILEVEKTASASDIKKAYRKLAHIHHPDKNNGNAESENKFKNIQEAYQVLSNEEKRKKYDMLGSNWQQHRTGGGTSNDFNWNDWYDQRQAKKRQTVNDVFEQGGMSDFFERIFGSRNKSSNSWNYTPPPSQGEDYTAYINISLEEAYFGTEKNIFVNNHNITVRFKAGISNGHTQKISGKGMPGTNGGANGDLLIKVNVEEHKTVEIKGNDLFLHAKIDIFTAMLGGQATIKTFGGKLKINIPEGTQSGKKLKLLGQGMPIYNSNEKRGDLYIIIEVKLPENLSVEEKSMIAELQKKIKTRKK